MNLRKFNLTLLSGVLIFSLDGLKNNQIENKNDNGAFVGNSYLGDSDTKALFGQLMLNQNNDVFVDNTYAAYYFNNLRENFGNNVYGSCGYIAIEMMLSFYDCYMDDNIIDNNFDVVTTFDNQRQKSADFDIVPFNAESPGCRYEPTNLCSKNEINEYFDIVSLNQDTYFQFKLIELANRYFGAIKIDTNGLLGLNGKNIYDLLKYYLFSYKNYSEENVSIKALNNSTSSIDEEVIVKNIELGIPTILIVENGQKNEAHTVVAYDYDSTNKKIYVHSGWRDEASNSSLTHVSLDDLGYTIITDAIYLDVNTPKNMGLKYFNKNGDGYTSAIFEIPQNLKISNGDYVDICPTFYWNSLFNEKWDKNVNPYFDLRFLNTSNQCILEIDKISDTFYTLNSEQWDKVNFSNQDKEYYVYLTLKSDEFSYWDDYWCKVKFQKPELYENHPYVLPNEYGFADEYPVDYSTANIFNSHNVRDFKFQTKRYRVGYIHNEDIVMSPIRKGISQAYIEFRFETAISRIDVDLSYWRNANKEILNNINGTSEIQQFVGNKWSTILDLLSSETNLSEDRNDKKTYKIVFTQPIYKLRFYSAYNESYDYDGNRGRISIGKIAFYETEYNLPLSDSELDYEPSLWNEKVTSTFLWYKHYAYEYSNCYSYALNAQQNPTTKTLVPMQPGQSCGFSLSASDLLNTEKVLSYIRKDAIKLGFVFNEIDANEICSEGTYKVALVIDNQKSVGERYASYDYHWYRQNSDGSWSHKPGTTYVKNTDCSDKLIMDPRTCNRDSGNGLNYNLFVGFFELSPLNIMI